MKTNPTTDRSASLRGGGAFLPVWKSTKTPTILEEKGVGFV